MKKLLITSAVQLSQLLNNNPNLLSIPAFSRLSNLVTHLNAEQPKKGSCSACNNRSNPYIKLRPQLEASLAAMQPSDFLTMKSILKVDQICYYKQDQITKKLTQICL